jgi:hypothetical protein
MLLDWCCHIHGIIARVDPLDAPLGYDPRTCPVAVRARKLCGEPTYYRPDAGPTRVAAT